MARRSIITAAIGWSLVLCGSSMAPG